MAAAGIAVNLVAAGLLLRPSRRSLNVRGAFLHVATDVAAFVGTAVAGALILVTGWDRFDPIASLAVAALIFWSAASLLRESTRILLEGSPIDPQALTRELLAVPQVVEVHDLHVWTVTSGFPALSAHVLVEEGADCHAIRRHPQLRWHTRGAARAEPLTPRVEHAPDGRVRVKLPLRR